MCVRASACVCECVRVSEYKIDWQGCKQNGSKVNKLQVAALAPLALLLLLKVRCDHLVVAHLN